MAYKSMEAWQAAYDKGETLLPPNNLGPGWHFIPLQDSTPIAPHTEEMRDAMQALATGKTVFELLSLKGPDDQLDLS